MKAALIACSDGLSPRAAASLDGVLDALRALGLEAFCAGPLSAPAGACAAPARERAEALNALLRREDMAFLFDVSGGDSANELLPLIDWEAAAHSRAVLCGYSDLTCLLNAFHARTRRPCVLWQARWLCGGAAGAQRAYLARALAGAWEPFSAQLVRGNAMKGALIGGNARCLLKLAGTPYWPDVSGRVLLLEGMSGGEARVRALFAQLAQTGAFAAAAGVVLGTFTQLDAECGPDAAVRIALDYLPAAAPLARTREIGHGEASRAAVLGAPLALRA